jgi:AraC-like DNA-binding protein
MQQTEGELATIEPSLAKLARLIARQARTAGDHSTKIPALSLHRRDRPTEPVPCIYPLGLVVIAQGSKQVLMGDRVLDYAPGQSMLVSVDLPVISHVTRASRREPFLGALLRLDAGLIAQVASEMTLRAAPVSHEPVSVSIEALQVSLLDAVRRFVALLEEPATWRNLAPLIEREIAIRLLSGPHGAHLRQLMWEQSPGRRIPAVVAWMKQNFASEFGVADLAARANMSVSSFRKHFGDAAGMSPLRYLKQLRLQEGRQLMLNHGLDAGRAATRVGYQSASQFSREYSRLFGAPPQRDVQRMRARTRSVRKSLHLN